jgi:hypothetical protein
MAGATGNTLASRDASSISPSLTVPAVPTGTTAGGSVGGNAGGNRPQGGGNRPGAGQQGGGNGGNRPGVGQQGGGFQPNTSGERPSLNFSREGGGLASLFGGSGGNFSSRFNRNRDETTSWFNFGGFGANASTITVPNGATNPIDGSEWTPSGTATGSLPTAPSTMQNTSSVITAQQEARDLTTQAAQEAAQTAQNNAQQAYDQFWADYYTAVDYAAQSYYQTVTASVDYAQQAYYDALNYTTTTIDYYVDYAAEYAEYCYYYPWDCYSYAYDETSGTYTNVEYVSDQPVATVTTGTVAVNWSAVGNVPVSSAEAYEALVVFANDQLGTVVQPLYAGDATQEIQQIMTQLPAEVEGYAALLSGIDTAYWGILNGGVGVVGKLDCSTGCSGENIPAELSSGSAGIYMLSVASPMPADSAGALALITQVYPALNGLAFAEVTNVETGMAYMATAYGLGEDANGQGITLAKVVYTGVMSINNQTVVYALVGVGEAQLQAFFSLMQ